MSLSPCRFQPRIRSFKPSIGNGRNADPDVAYVPVNYIHIESGIPNGDSKIKSSEAAKGSAIIPPLNWLVPAPFQLGYGGVFPQYPWGYLQPAFPQSAEINMANPYEEYWVCESQSKAHLDPEKSLPKAALSESKKMSSAAGEEICDDIRIPLAGKIFVAENLKILIVKFRQADWQVYPASEVWKDSEI